ncbi:MAG: selenide, water dikinase [Gemmatales bacterium]|nr:MAG: selenide, water dikinase [Gemmatales bacterium]
MLRDIPKVDDPNVLVGTATHDDAGVYKLTDDLALVQTLDFFPPVVNDAFLYGQIAAANALSDVYAMGGTPRTALNLVGYPDDKEDLSWLGQILQGGAERCRQAQTAVIGGHTVRDAEIKFGLAVTGTIHPDKILTNAQAQPGDVLVLTKPLGTGFVTTAHKANSCPEDVFEAACASMIQLNQVGRDAMMEVGAHAATDITGFGLAGHAFEMAQGSGVTIEIELGKLPLLPGSEALARRPYLTRASATNAAYVEKYLRRSGELDPVRLEFFYDAQTSGGLLISVAADKAEALLEKLKEKQAKAAAVIGRVVERTDAALVLLP